MDIEDNLTLYFIELMVRLGLFTLVAVFAPFLGRRFPKLIWQGLKLTQLFVSLNAKQTYDNFIKSFQNLITITGTFLIIALALSLLIKYEDLYQFIGFFVYLILSVTLAWIALKITRQLIRRSVILVVQRWFGEVTEAVLIFETLIYVFIIILAGILFAIGLRLNITAIVASLGISGVAVAFGAQQTLSRLFGTLEIYLDRPYRPGEYIRINFNPYDEDAYGRIESIGLRSTKIRLIARNTIAVVPNSLMADKNIENVSRGKKIVAMLCLDFFKVLDSGERALVKQVVNQASQVFWGFDQASIHVQFCASDEQSGTRARIIFFISSADQSSLDLRKRLLELANSAIAHKLGAYNLKFNTPEPVVYIDSPMSL